jgi:hypothetical protein
MRAITTKLFCLIAIACANSVEAYDLATHAKITNFAYGQSQLNLNNSVQLKRLGIDGWVLGASSNSNPFGAANGNYYFDIAGSQVQSRSVKSYEVNIMEKIELDTLAQKIPGWLMRGAIREDDGGTLAGLRNFEPLDDPYGNFNRFCNHFLDPVYSRGGVGRGFSKFCLFETPIYDAAQWALGTQSPFSAQPPENTGRRNHFTVLDARDSMWRALTLKEKGGADVPKFGFTNEEVRKIYWATTFRSLGNVIHLLQDQGQPQHTRNEGHGGSNKGYEEYIDSRAKGDAVHKIDGITLKAESGQLPDLTYGGYSKPQFARYSDYWSTKLQNGVQSAGLTDYSNRGFFTLDTNFGNTVYPLPSSQLSNYTPTSVFQSAVGGSFRYLSGTVNDGLTGGSDVITMTTQGIFSEMGLAGPIPSIRKYTLSKQNYDDRAALLIPRAVAYSAGLIDYFFRGSMEVTPPDEGIYSLVDHFDFAGEGKPATNASQGFKGFKTIKLKLRNTTPDINLSGGGGSLPQGMVSGKLVAVLKFHRNNNYSDDLAGEPAAPQDYINNRSPDEEIVVSDRVKDDTGSVQSTITLPADPNKTAPAKLLYFEFDKELPINATDVRLQIVYRGNLGSEADAVAVETIDISEPTYYTYMNASDYIRLNKKVYTRAEINATGTAPGVTESGSTLRALVQPTSCIDQMTNQLSPSCLNEIAINYPLIFGTPSANNNTTVQIALPQARTYVRLAALIPLTGVIIDQSASNCVPRDPINLVANRIQTDYTETGGSSTFVTLSSPPVRAVKGGAVSCVLIGDGSAPDGSTDNRNAQMKALTGVNLKPKQLQNFKFGAP